MPFCTHTQEIITSIDSNSRSPHTVSGLDSNRRSTEIAAALMFALQALPLVIINRHLILTYILYSQAHD